MCEVEKKTEVFPSLPSVDCVRELARTLQVMATWVNQMESVVWPASEQNSTTGLPCSSPHSIDRIDETDWLFYRRKWICNNRSRVEGLVASMSQNGNVNPYPGYQTGYPQGSLRTENLEFILLSLIKKYFPNS